MKKPAAQVAFFFFFFYIYLYLFDTRFTIVNVGKNIYQGLSGLEQDQGQDLKPLSLTKTSTKSKGVLFCCPDEILCLVVLSGVPRQVETHCVKFGTKQLQKKKKMKLEADSTFGLLSHLRFVSDRWGEKGIIAMCTLLEGKT